MACWNEAVGQIIRETPAAQAVHNRGGACLLSRAASVTAVGAWHDCLVKYHFVSSLVHSIWVSYRRSQTGESLRHRLDDGRHQAKAFLDNGGVWRLSLCVVISGVSISAVPSSGGFIPFYLYIIVSWPPCFSRFPQPSSPYPPYLSPRLPHPIVVAYQSFPLPPSMVIAALSLLFRFVSLLLLPDGVPSSARGAITIHAPHGVR